MICVNLKFDWWDSLKMHYRWQRVLDCLSTLKLLFYFTLQSMSVVKQSYSDFFFYLNLLRSFKILLRSIFSLIHWRQLKEKKTKRKTHHFCEKRKKEVRVIITWGGPTKDGPKWTHRALHVSYGCVGPWSSHLSKISHRTTKARNK